MTFIYARSRLPLLNGLVVHHPVPLASLVLTKPKHFHGPGKSLWVVPLSSRAAFRALKVIISEGWTPTKAAQCSGDDN